MHVLDLDNDGLISAAELTDALRFLRANLDEQDLVALLDR
jgi:Ca2+-binding EF-hand superfamily protein